MGKRAEQSASTRVPGGRGGEGGGGGKKNHQLSSSRDQNANSRINITSMFRTETETLWSQGFLNECCAQTVEQRPPILLQHAVQRIVCLFHCLTSS